MFAYSSVQLDKSRVEKEFTELLHFSYLRDHEADKFQNLTSSSSSADTSAVKFS